MSDGGPAFTEDNPDLRALLSNLKEVNKQVATNLRRELRAAGDDIIAAQRRVLKQKPGAVRTAGKVLRLIKPKNGRKPYFAFRQTYESDAPREGGVSKLRDKISKGLRTRVVTTSRREGVEIRTSGPRVDGYNMARVWQSARFRHPVFGDRSKWLLQSGQPYFFEPVTKDLRTNMRARIDAAINEALQVAGR
jgi:hypothetical protein